MSWGVCMNIQQSMVKISIISLALLCNVAFGMKRLPESDIQAESLRRTKAPRVMVSDQEYLEKSFAFSMPSLNLTETLNKITIPNGTVHQLPALTKLALLNKIIEPKLKNIDEVQLERSMLLKNNMTSDEAKRWIAAEHNKIYAQLRNDKTEALNQLLHAYNIDTDSDKWYITSKQINDRVAFDLESMRQPRNDTTWCPNVPTRFAQLLIDEMQESGLEPTSFDVKILEDKYLNVANAGFCASFPIGISIDKSISFEESKKNPAKRIYGYKNGKPGRFSYHPRLADKDDAYLLQTVKHEIRHALEGDDTKRKAFASAIINHNPEVTPDQIMLHPAYAQYVKTHENAADILPALKDAKAAQCCIKTTALYPDSYGAIRMIHTNFEVLAEIEKRDQQNSTMSLLS